MKKYILFLMFFLINYSLFAQQIKGVVLEENGSPILGASVRWQDTSIGAITDMDGGFAIELSEKSSQLIVQYTGFISDTIQVKNKNKALKVVLKSGLKLEELQVVERTQALIYSRNTVDLSQIISSDELCKAACCNLSESFETNPSVDVAYSDAATGAKQIKLLGLSGTYVQMLSENVPAFKGLAAPYGLGYVPGPWMESIQVSKGASSVINGYESLTGQINVEYLKPSKADYINVNAFASDAGRLEGNLGLALPISKKLSTNILAHIEDESQVIDANNDGFADLPMMKQQNLMNKWQYLSKYYMLNVMLRALNEERRGGQLSDIVNPYTIELDNSRYEFYVKNGFLFHDKHKTSVGLIMSGSKHNNNSSFGFKTYDAEQTNWYSNLIYQTEISKSQKLSAGASFNYDKYNESIALGNFDSEESVEGIFAEYTYIFKDKFIALAGIRADHSSVYGSFVTPRFHLKYMPLKQLHFRASAGKGYRTPKILAENSFYLASNRSLVIAPDLDQEEAWNYGLTATAYLPINNKDLTLQAEWFYTDFLHQAVLDLDSDPHAAIVSNLDGVAYASSMQLEASYELLRGWTLTAAHRITDTRATINGVLREKPLANRSKTLFTTSYQTKLKKWQFDFTTQINGGGRLPDADVNAPLWKEEFDSFTIINAQITKYFRTWSIYLGAENLTDFTQDNPIVDAQNPMGSDFDATMVWGPVHGRKIYAGFRWSLSK